MGKNNVQLWEEKNTAIKHWGLRKLSVGVASVLLGTTAYLGMSNGAVVHADTIASNNNAAGDGVAANSKGAMSQNLYQSDDLQTAKGQTSTNDTGTTQTISANNQRKQSAQTINGNVTNSKNSNSVVNTNSGNKQSKPIRRGHSIHGKIRTIGCDFWRL